MSGRFRCPEADANFKQAIKGLSLHPGMRYFAITNLGNIIGAVLKRSAMANFLLLSCFSPQFKKAKVIQPDGLALKDRPSMNGKQLALMKEKEEVLVQRDDGPEETLYGRKSRWFEVEYILRGGYWGSAAQNIRVSSRNFSIPDGRYISVGFRLVFLPED